MAKCLMIVLDTHVLMWWVNGSDLLSVTAEKAIKKSLIQGSEVLVSAGDGG